MASNEDVIASLFSAIASRDLDTFQNLLKRYPDSLRNEDGHDIWLYTTAEAGHLEFVKFLVEEMGIGPDEMKSQNGLQYPRPVVIALANGHKDVAIWLLDNGAQLNSVIDGVTECELLSVAARHGMFDMVKLLVERGAAINVNHGGRSNVYMVASTDDIREYLRSKGVVDLRDITPHDYPASHDYLLKSFEELAEEDGDWGELIEWEMKFPGEPEIVMHCREPGEGCDSRLLFTVGLSDVMLEFPDSRFDEGLELMMWLPPGWPLSEEHAGDNSWDVPMIILDRLGRQILARGKQNFLYAERDMNRALWSLEVGDEPQKSLAAGTELSAWLLLGVAGGRMPDCREVGICEAVPIYAEEADFLREKMDYVPLLTRFQALGITRTLNLKRLNAVTDWPEHKTGSEVDGWERFTLF